MSNNLKALAGKLLRRICRNSSSRIGNEEIERRCGSLMRASSFFNKAGDQEMAAVIFSMDRALQLHALLGSYRDNVINGPKLNIVYRTTSERHEISYVKVLDEYADLIETAVSQNDRKSFRRLLIELIESSRAEHLFFLVDDNLFIESLDLRCFARSATPYSIPSMRMGENLSYCYTVQKNQLKPLLEQYPDGSDCSSELRYWFWGNEELDWAYPLSVDGHLFQRKEILALAQSIEFDSPNTFEGALQEYSFAYQWRLGVCYKKSRLINIPYNRVQNDVMNIHGEVHQDEMLKMWEDGYRIDRAAYYGFANHSAHQELPLQLTKA